MNAATLPAPPARRHGRRMLALIAGLLCLPFLVATLLWRTGWQPARQINHGQLLIGPGLPLRQVDDQTLSRLAIDRPSGGDSLRSPHRDSLRSQKKLPNATLAAPVAAENGIHGHWTLVLATPDECAASCLEQLHLARQVQVSLNKDMTRLRRALIGPQLHDAAGLAAVAERWPDLAIARIDAAGWPTLAGDEPAPHLVLLDPQGRLLLRYAASPDPQGLRRDIERLLRYSWQG